MDTLAHHDVIVIGGGQAGLAIGYHLARAGRQFTILDAADTPAAAWKSRWDSLKLFTPARYDGLPGRPFPGDPGHCPARDEVVDYLTDYLWWAFALTALLMVPLVVLLSSAISDAAPTLVSVATTVGVLAAAVQFLGLIRWPFLVPYLARTAADPHANPTRQQAVDIVFQSFNRYLGVAVGEHLGDLLTGAWTTLAGIALTQTSVVPSWIGMPGIAIGPVLMLCSLEFVGRHEPTGWKLAERLTPVAYIAWSLWLIVTGIALLA